MKLIIASFCIAAIGAAFILAPNSKPILKAKQIITKSINTKNVGDAKLEAKKKEDEKIAAIENASLKLHGQKIKTYLKANNYCEEYCFLVNMKIAPGKKRFFIYDLKFDSVLEASLVTHGGGSETNTGTLKFCNVPSSGSTSLGKYKIGVEYSGQFGMAFKLHGLEASNDKAFERFVVLHSHSCVPEDEVYPQEICTSLGCPTVNPAFLPKLKKYIDKADKPVVLWIFY